MKKRDTTGDILSLSLILGFFAFLYVLSFVDIPKENKDLLNMLLGAWLVNLGIVIQYRFGGSKNSSIKDETINTQAKTQANTLTDGKETGD